jgi:hypothetical protein
VTATSSIAGLIPVYTIDASTASYCSISGQLVSFLKSGACIISINQDGSINYLPATEVQQTVSVGSGTQTLTFTSTAPTAAKVNGLTYTPTATSNRGLSVSFSVDPTSASVCSLSAGVVSFTAVGTCKVNADQIGNSDYSAATRIFQTFAVAIGSQTVTITSAAPPAPIVGGPTYTVTAAASSQLPVGVTVAVSTSSICSISGNVVSFLAVGRCTLQADQAGNTNYLAAAQVLQTFGVGLTAQSITVTSSPSGSVVGGTPYTIIASASSGLIPVVTIDVSTATICSATGNAVTFLAAGNCLINIDQGGNATFNSAPQVVQQTVVGKGTQVLSVSTTAPAAAVGGAMYAPVGVSSAGLSVLLAIDPSSVSVCSMSLGVVSFFGQGNCRVALSQSGSFNYNAATGFQDVAVGKGSQTVSFSSSPGGAQVAGPTYTVAATASSGLAVTFGSVNVTVCTVAGNVVTFVAVGNCAISASQSGTSNWNPAVTVTQTFAVFKGTQSLSFTSTAPVGAIVNGAAYTVTGTSSSGLTVVFSIDFTATSICTISGNQVNFIGGGICVVNADQSGSSLYLSSPRLQQSKKKKEEKKKSFVFILFE